MIRVTLPPLGFVQVWRDAARLLASHDTPPESVIWSRDAAADLFGGGDPLPEREGPARVTAPASFQRLVETVLCHRDPQAPSWLYQALHRHQRDRRALSNPADPLTRRLEELAKPVRREIHKMHAFVRFRELPAAGPRRSFGAWFEPEHAILEAATPFFAKRFADMDWMIATPQGVARFDGRLTFHPPAPRPDLPEDASEALWGTYFANIFNPARLAVKAMQSEMPRKYWSNLPETRLIPEMLAGADARVAAMRAAMPTDTPARAQRILDRQAPQMDSQRPQTLAEAQHQAAACRRCGLCEAATQTVWGEGPPDAPLMIVGEAPGDAEDLSGRPFVGPAGQLLREELARAEIGPAWLTNAVKHFKFTPRGKRRLHQNPTRGEISHCRWWLDLEREMVRPKLTVALGASAAFALTGSAAPLTPRRGRIEPATDGGPVLLTWHPSRILRLPPPDQPAARAELAADLSTAREVLSRIEAG
ncbi:UdgX family uracil-DNA binding protein [Paracoccus jeotgali]|uniref:UdgX family uracil-DNA binding protein n=1 Tax=Paracoccus jeotgali TaxID=2065379 RepID=UPI0035E43E72